MPQVTSATTVQPSSVDKAKSRRGFASMDPQRQREIAAAGGRQSHLNGTAHEFTPETAREAAKKSAVNRTVNAGKRRPILTLGTSRSGSSAE